MFKIIASYRRRRNSINFPSISQKSGEALSHVKVLLSRKPLFKPRHPLAFPVLTFVPVLREVSREV